jgi:hypothetical protein
MNWDIPLINGFLDHAFHGIYSTIPWQFDPENRLTPMPFGQGAVRELWFAIFIISSTLIASGPMAGRRTQCQVDNGYQGIGKLYLVYSEITESE